MDRNFKMALAVTSLILGILTGTNFMVSNDSRGPWLGWALLFFGLAVLLWLWMRRDDHEAAQAAREALKESKDNLQGINATTQAVVDAAQSAKARVEEALGQVGVESQTSETTDEATEAAAEAEAPSDEEGVTFQPAAAPAASRPAEAADPQAVDFDTPDDPGDQAKPAAEAETADGQAAAEALAEVPAVEETVTGEDTTAQPVAEAATEEDATAEDEVDHPDDLSRIEGIGPKYAEILIEAGIMTFAQLAALSTDEIVELVRDRGGRKSASMETWAEQAKLAAEGDWDGLDQLQDELKGGRR